MLVVDDLVSWLVGRLADAGYKKLSTLVRGSEQERALKRAVAAAVQATADEISPADKKQAGQVAKRISGAFGKPTPATVLPRKLTPLEGLYAGIAQQLSVLDEGGQLPPGLLGVPVSVVAALLGDHLIDEIRIRGAAPGPLTPLAGQLNHDLTHLQQEQLKIMLAQLLGEVRDALTAPGSIAGPAGWPLAEVWDPFLLEVHHPVEPDIPDPGLPALPVYVPRDHDTALAGVVTEAAAGMSGIAVLVGGSSTGKTRACWQALEPLRRAGGWRLWHPVDRQAALDGLPGVGPRTVVWLNEAQRHVGPADGTGERVAAGLRELRRDPARSPVLVLATLWPEFWDELTARPPEGGDPHAQARELLAAAAVIWVPEAFTDEQVGELEGAGDPRLAQAAAGSRDGQVIQYLAGARELLDRYHQARPAARALIHAAMDARRLGARAALPRAFLEAAAPGYLSNAEWDLLPGDWLKQALGYAAKPCKGVPGPLTPNRPRPSSDVPPSPVGGPGWQLADYLGQHGRRINREEIPPASFWAAAASRADPADLTALAKAARDRGLLRDAARLYKQASAHVDAMAGVRLVHMLRTLQPGDQRPAGWAAAHASLDDPYAVASLLSVLQDAGASDQVATLLDRDPAAHASLDNPHGVARLLVAMRRVGATGQIATLLDRDPAAHASFDDPFGVTSLLDALREAGATGQHTALATRAACVSLDDPGAVAGLLVALVDARATGQVTALLDRDPAACVSLDDPRSVAKLLLALVKARFPELLALVTARATGQVTTLASRATSDVSLDNPSGVASLLGALSAAGGTHTDLVTPLASRAAAHTSVHNPADVTPLLVMLSGKKGPVSTLASRAAAHTSLDNPDAVAELLEAMLRVDAGGQVITTLLDRDPGAHASLDNSASVARLLDALQWVRDNSRRMPEGLAQASGQVITTLVDRDPAAHASLDDTLGVANLLITLQWGRASGQVATLLDRDPAAHASLDDPAGVARLLDALQNAGASGQVATLLDRDPAAHASLGETYAVTKLLEALREAGAAAQAAALIERLPAAGMFQLFLKQEGREEKFRFGREADGHPAKRWDWTDLG